MARQRYDKGPNRGPCPTCNGTGTTYEQVTDEKGRSKNHSRPCKGCGGSGTVFT